MTLNMDPRAEEGSFDDRRKKATLEPVELLKVLRQEVINISVDWPYEEDIGKMEVCILCCCFVHLDLAL